jgi:hypothetical protein
MQNLNVLWIIQKLPIKTCVAHKMKIYSFNEIRKISAVLYTAVVLIVTVAFNVAVSDGYTYRDKHACNCAIWNSDF